MVKNVRNSTWNCSKGTLIGIEKNIYIKVDVLGQHMGTNISKYLRSFKHYPTTTLGVGGPKKSTTLSFPKLDMKYSNSNIKTNYSFPKIDNMKFDNKLLKTVTGKVPNWTPKSLFGDTDKDKTLNFRDCKPNNPKKHGGEAFGYYLWQKGIRYHPDTTKKHKKNIRKVFEKNPELIYKTQETDLNYKGKDVAKTRTYIYQGDKYPNSGFFAAGVPSSIEREKGTFIEKDLVVIPKKEISTIRGPIPYGKVMAHELQHREDLYTLTDEQIESERKAKKVWEAKYDTDEYRKRFEGKPDSYVDVKSEKAYEQLPSERRAIAAERATPVRNIKVPESKVNKAYRNLMADKDKDGIIAAADNNDNDPNNPRGFHKETWDTSLPKWWNKHKTKHDDDVEKQLPVKDNEPPWGMIKAKQKQKEREEVAYQEYFDELNQKHRLIHNPEEALKYTATGQRLNKKFWPKELLEKEEKEDK